MSIVVVAIDGPAAAGKGTLARRIAHALRLPYLDTGLLYRAVGRRVLDAGGDPAEPEAAISAARALLASDLDRDDLRGPEADAAAAAVASIADVRAALLEFQRDFAAERGAVLDGRDIGTVIFPDACAKLFVTADLATRAGRRHAELEARGVTVPFGRVMAEMQARDAADRDRAEAPLRAADDAFVLDTSGLDPEQTLREALRLLGERLGRPI